MIKRQIDILGRIVLPAEMRRSLNIVSGDSVVMALKGQNIVISPTKSYCALCGKVTDLIEVEDSAICKSCLNKAKAAL